MRLLIFVSVLVILVSLGVLIGVIIKSNQASKKKLPTGSEDKN